MISSPEAAKLVLVSKAHLFKPTFPPSKERMIGKEAIFFHQGHYHSNLRRLLLRSFMPDSIKTIVSHIDSIALRSLDSLQGRALINTFQEMKTVCIYNICWLFIFSLILSLQKQSPLPCPASLSLSLSSIIPAVRIRSGIAFHFRK